MKNHLHKIKFLIALFIFITTVLSCSKLINRDSTSTSSTKSDTVSSSDIANKNKELELKQKELELKEKELEFQKDKDAYERDRELVEEREVQVRKDNNYNKNSYTSSYAFGDFPITALRRLTDYDISGLSRTTLQIMRNEIFARHGYIFSRDDLSDYFNRKAWYTPSKYNVEKELSDIEKYNVNFIKSYE
jgi:hypothetical protein